MYIGTVAQTTGELLESLRRLIPQLAVHKAAPTWEEVDTLLRSETSRLLIARYPDESGRIEGILTLIVYRAPTGLRAIVEDVVVDEDFRRRGIAQALLHHALSLARESGADGVTLTSNPRREAANRLYQVIGFEQRQTNAYIYRLK